MSKYREVRQELAEKMGAEPSDPGDALLPCRYCGEPTQRKLLSLYGARCERCYRQYIEVGYSGARPPRQCRQAAWVPEAQRRVIRRSTAAHVVLDDVRDRMAPKSIDDINAALRETGDIGSAP